MGMGLITSVRSLKFSLKDRVIIRRDRLMLNGVRTNLPKHFPPHSMAPRRASNLLVLHGNGEKKIGRHM